jgi:hypothetical protein
VAVDCAAATLPINQGTVCVVTVDDVDSGLKSNPAGTVDFSSDESGSFSSESCELAPVASDPDSSSCQVGYRPTADAGTHTITGAYLGSDLHEGDTGTDTIAVTLRDTAVAVDCDSPVAIDEASTCVVTVTDTDGGSASAPSGEVEFSRNATLSATGSTGSFDSTSCTLVDNVDGESSSCSVEYTPTSVAGDHVIDAAYQGSALHEASNDSFTIRAELRPSSTTIDCDPEVVALGSPSTCTVTVTDVEGAGTKSSPTGNVSFATSGSGTFTPGQCALLPNPDGESSSCSVLYASTVASVDTISASYLGSDVHASSSGTFQYVVTYNPDGGFVTGGGWINSPAGASALFPTATGRANFGFVSKYQKGASIPTGNTEFQFHAGNLNFKSTVYEWLVISGSHRAQYKGSGTINGTGNYGFMLTAIDEDRRNPGQPDRFRIRIWNKTTGAVVYDNQIGVGDDADLNTPGTLVQGSIVIHVPKK